MSDLPVQVTVAGVVPAEKCTTPQNACIWVPQELVDRTKFRACELACVSWNDKHAVARVEVICHESLRFAPYQHIVHKVSNDGCDHQCIVDSSLLAQFGNDLNIEGAVITINQAQFECCASVLHMAVCVNEANGSRAIFQDLVADSLLSVLFHGIAVFPGAQFNLDDTQVWVETVETTDENPIQSSPTLSISFVDANTSLNVREVHCNPFRLTPSKTNCDTQEWTSSLLDEIGSPFEPISKYLVKWACDEASTPSGLLISGPPGSGKTTLVKQWARIGGLNMHEMELKSVYKSTIGAGESYVVDLITKKAINDTPSVIFVDDIDNMFPNTTSTSRTVSESRLVPVFLSALDTLQKVLSENNSLQVLVVACTSRSHDIAPNVLLPRYFGHKIEMPSFQEADRFAILNKCLESAPIMGDRESVLRNIAKRANGLVVAELCTIVRDAQLSQIEADRQCLTEDDLLDAVAAIPPSALRNSTLLQVSSHTAPPSTSSQVDFNLPGLFTPQAKLTTSVLLPLRQPDLLLRMGISSPRGVLLHGPSGNGKSLLGSWLNDTITREGLANFVTVSCADLISKVVGASEQAIVSLFAKARLSSPCVLFMDHIEAIAPRRGFDNSSEQTFDRILSCLLMELDGMLSKNGPDSPVVLLVAATEVIETLDPAVLRPGRFDKTIHVSLPSAKERREILLYTIKNSPVEQEGVLVDLLVAKTEGWSAASLTGICREAAMLCLRNDLSAVTIDHQHFIDALENIDRT